MRIKFLLWTTQVLIGNLCLHVLSALQIAKLLVPRHSKTTWPRFTGKNQSLKAPLPFPILDCKGFFVKGFCGKILITTLPSFFINLRKTFLAASNCFKVILLKLRLISPKEPKFKVGFLIFLLLSFLRENLKDFNFIFLGPEKNILLVNFRLIQKNNTIDFLNCLINF